jgi:poly(3-hydroxybutyrate) depolymerase
MRPKNKILKRIAKSLLLLIIVTTSYSNVFGQNNGQGQYLQNQSLQHTSGNRKYSIYIPKNYKKAEAVPLVLLFHGFFNDINTMYNDAQMEAIADANNFIFAIPQGLGSPAGWSIGLSFGGNADDIGFASSLIDKISTDYTINKKRIYAAGFSNGGFFSYRLACELSTKIAAIASVAGSMNPNWIGGSNPTCKPQHPTPIMQITGTSDNVIPIGGGGSGGGASLKTVFDYWTKFNGTNVTPTVSNINSATERSVYEKGNKGSTVEFIKIEGRGHEWPKITTGGLRENASIRIWQFFSRYDLDGEINTLSVDSFDKTTVSIFPNPASTTLSINNIDFKDKLQYTITSIAGQVVLKGEITSASQQIDIAHLNASMYFLKIEDATFKILKTL